MLSRYKPVKNLGNGSFGSVILVYDTEDSNKLKAMKIIPHGHEESSVADIIKEASIIANLKHPNIVEYYAHFLDEYNYKFYIITEYCEDGSLGDLLRKIPNNRFPEDVIVGWLQQINSALKYLHSKKVLHRDVKTANILVKNQVLKLCDFGVSKVLLNTVNAETFAGTEAYMSPEIILGKKYTHKADIWSEGICLYEMCTINFPFQGRHDILNNYVPYMNNYSIGLNNILKGLLERDQMKRYSAEQLEYAINSLKYEKKMPLLNGENNNSNQMNLNGCAHHYRQQQFQANPPVSGFPQVPPAVPPVPQLFYPPELPRAYISPPHAANAAQHIAAERAAMAQRAAAEEREAIAQRAAAAERAAEVEREAAAERAIAAERVAVAQRAAAVEKTAFEVEAARLQAAKRAAAAEKAAALAAERAAAAAERAAAAAERAATALSAATALGSPPSPPSVQLRIPQPFSFPSPVLQFLPQFPPPPFLAPSPFVPIRFNPPNYFPQIRLLIFLSV